MSAPILCPHGVATSWCGLVSVDEPLPLCEHCEECNPGAITLPTSKEQQ